MKSFKTALFAASIALLLQGCGDNSDSDDELIGLAFLENGTYIHVQVDETGSIANLKNGMEWGNCTVDAVTGILTTTMIYDDNGGTGLSEPRTRYARVTENTTLLLKKMTTKTA